MKVQLSFDNSDAQVIDVSDSQAWIPVTPPKGMSRGTLRFSIPLRDIQGYWHAQCIDTLSGFLRWRFDFSCSAQHCAPVLAFFNRAGLNRCLVATDNLTDDTRFQCAMNQECATYEVTLTFTSEKAFRVLLDLTEESWQERLAAWREALTVAEPIIPEAAWEPVYCTWYAIHGAVTEEWVEKIVDVAAPLGFRTLIIDDGWCYDECKRVSPATIHDWYAPVGDWRVSEKKFPGFPEHVKRVQAKGMKYLLWVAPHLIGDRSELAKAHPEAIVGESHEGCRYLNVTHKKLCRDLVGKLERLVADNGLDGLKVDFLDIVKSDVDAPNGKDTLEFIQQISEAIRRAAPNALIEYRQRYDTMGMRPYATQFRAGDCPFDYLLNFHRIMSIHLNMGSQVPVHADPAYWGANETLENISRHFIAMMPGVPMLSMDLLAFSPEEMRIARHWLGFYQEHRPLLNHGEWHIDYFGQEIRYAYTQNEEERIVVLCDQHCLEETLADAPAKVHLLNLSPTAIPLPVPARVWNMQGEETKTASDANGNLVVPTSIPEGGRALL